jgi:hypothetical protein
VTFGAIVAASSALTSTSPAHQPLKGTTLALERRLLLLLLPLLCGHMLAEAGDERPSQPVAALMPPRSLSTVEPTAAQALEVGGGSVSLDEMGPVIVHTDGSISRISNWAEMSERERAVAARRISARNAGRIASLKASSAELEASAGAQPTQEQ